MQSSTDLKRTFVKLNDKVTDQKDQIKRIKRNFEETENNLVRGMCDNGEMKFYGPDGRTFSLFDIGKNPSQKPENVMVPFWESLSVEDRIGMSSQDFVVRFLRHKKEYNKANRESRLVIREDGIKGKGKKIDMMTMLLGSRVGNDDRYTQREDAIAISNHTVPTTNRSSGIVPTSPQQEHVDENDTEKSDAENETEKSDTENETENDSKEFVTENETEYETSDETEEETGEETAEEEDE